MSSPIHQHAAPLHLGASLETARLAVILLHGRGSSAANIMGLAHELGGSDVAYLAPQATNGSWYPFTFLAPLSHNEPFLSAALAAVATLIAQVEAAGIPAERIVLGGFSQGACLSSEFLARNPRRYGGLLAFSGGLIGPPGTPRDYPGDLAGTPAFIGCSDVDSHIPLARVTETADVLGRLGAQVKLQIYPGMGHTINDDELHHARVSLGLG
ncbi:MAG: alpha/beta hydrolase [Oscillochloridaceae bacterium umkhey_bin13]